MKYDRVEHRDAAADIRQAKERGAIAARDLFVEVVSGKKQLSDPALLEEVEARLATFDRRDLALFVASVSQIGYWLSELGPFLKDLNRALSRVQRRESGQSSTGFFEFPTAS